ncbi:hypothetical protein [Pontixanthobacter aquaemixtae]|uniref:Sulfotransferase family protein n=1 Tax=Pontixanthobacter aquaemixtae TaxID=1958940 RepID=A0A844ZXI7_9SPHN|nr:hypothetical protein [Pontixanthobacter aquaemixtae]MXO91656.1 hypothetical protein [Pontixanthobacter aquaemixtae]
MIYLRDPGLIFLKPHKVAGTSFEIALSKYAKPGDILTPLGRDEQLRAAKGLPGPQGHLYAQAELALATDDDRARAKRQQARGMGDGQPLKFYNHISASLVRDRLTDKEWSEAIKISIVRNPFDLAVSTYFWWQDRNAEEMPFALWCMEFHPSLRRNGEQYLIDGQITVDRFIRFEKFAEDIAALERDYPALSGLAEAFAGTRAKAGIRPEGAKAVHFFGQNRALRRLVEKSCAFEMEHFGYTLE